MYRNRGRSSLYGAAAMNPYADRNQVRPPWAFPYPGSYTVNATTLQTVTEKLKGPEEECPGPAKDQSDASKVIGTNLLVSFILFLIGIAVFIFATRSARNATTKPLLRRKQSTGSDWIRTFYSQKHGQEDLGSSRSSDDTSSDVVTVSTADELGFFLPVFWFWKTEEIERRCGKSAAQYLWFMENVQVFCAIVTAIGVLIMLPINLQGTMTHNPLDFGRTTLQNIHPRSPVLWVHVVFSLILFPLAMYFMRRFGKKFRGYTHPFTSTKTLMFEHLTTKNASESRIRQHFEEGFQTDAVEDVKMTYRTAKLTNMDKQRQKCNLCLKYYERTYLPGDERPLYAKDPCCVRCCCCCCDVGIDAIEYYSTKALDLENQIEELIETPKVANTTFFVTFASDDAAKMVLDRYQSIWKSFFSPVTSVSNLLRSKVWTAKLAPHPDKIKWKNLEVGGVKWYIYAIVLNFGLFVFLFFVSSPVILLNALGLAQWGKNLIILNQIIPALLLVELGFVIVGLVKFVTKMTRHHDKITMMLVTMKGSFVFSLITQLLLPTFGLTSAKALYNYLVGSAESEAFNWACVFLPDNGMVFVSFFIMQGLFGTSMSFSRVIELQVMAIGMCMSRSNAEKYLLSHKKQTFGFGTSYATNTCLASIVLVFVFIIPYMGPFGLFTLMMKDVAERYNMFFVSRIKEVPNAVHKTAINLFLFSVLFELYIFAFFMGIRTSTIGAGALVAGLVIYTAIYAYIVWLREWGKLAEIPVVGTVVGHLDSDNESDSYDPMTEPQNYEAPILRKYELLHSLSATAEFG